MENFIQRRDLVTSKELRGFSDRTNTAGTIRLALHLILIGFFGWLVWLSYGSWWIVYSWIPYGLLLAFLFAPLHECIHGTAFRSKPLNTLVGAVAGFLLLLPARYFRSFHFQHHRFTNDSERDPGTASRATKNFSPVCSRNEWVGILLVATNLHACQTLFG